MKKISIGSFACSTFLTLLISSHCFAQPVSTNEIKAQMVKDWERAKEYTIEYLNTMPADKYSFKTSDSVRSFAQQMLHIAQGNLFLMSNVSDEKPPAWIQSDIEHSTTSQKKDSVMYFVTSSYDYCIRAVKNTDDKKWGEKKKIFSFEETRFALMNKAFEHQSHHRGQTTIYIRMVGTKPPQEKLFQ